jgi:hypothetical protein
MRKSLVAVALVAGLGGCNGDKTSPTASESPAAIPTRAEGAIAEVGVTVSPIKVPATATGDPNFPWQISWVTTVKETAGVAARVDRILTFLVYDKITYAGPNLTAQGSPQLSANGSASFSQTLAYALPNGDKVAVVSVIVELTDAKGNRIQATAQLVIV